MRRDGTSKVACVVVAVIAAMSNGVAWAAPAPARVQVTGDTLAPKHAKAVVPQVRDATEGLLRDEHGVPIVDDAATVVVVELRPIVETKDADKVIFRVAVVVDGQEVYAGQPTSCWGCDQAKLLASVRTQVAGVVEHLPEHVEVEAPAAASETGAGDGATTAADQQGPAERAGDGAPQAAAPSMTLRNVGLGLVVPGGVALGVGVGMALAGNREVVDADEVEITERDYRPPGIALAVVGGVAAGVGIGLLVTHAVRMRSKGRGGERLSWSPVVNGSQAGVMLRGRF